MQWKFWQTPGPRELPVTVKNNLMTQFNTASESVDKMRQLGQPGRFANRPVRFIRIFDPALISGGAVADSKYHDFQLQASGERKALLFEGHIEKDGNVILSDRRLSTTDVKPTEAPAVTGSQ